MDTLRHVEGRVGSEWGTFGHKEAYAMARKVRFAKEDLRVAGVPASYRMAFDRDKESTK